MIVLIDAGHGSNTPGKRSPDGRLREYKWNREIALMLVERLKPLGIDARHVVTEDYDVSLTARVKRVNDICSQYGTSNVVLVSVHINAAQGGDQWREARGWSAWVAKNASKNSKLLARLLYDEALKRNLKGNRCTPPTGYWEANFTIISKTLCPAVLTENLFMDNRQDAEFLMSEHGKREIVDLHVAGIRRYIDA